jgi:hypothetical protein
MKLISVELKILVSPAALPIWPAYVGFAIIKRLMPTMTITILMLKNSAMMHTYGIILPLTSTVKCSFFTLDALNRTCTAGGASIYL